MDLGVEVSTRKDIDPSDKTNLGEYIDDALMDAYQGSQNVQEKFALRLAAMDLAEWQREQRFKVERMMVLKESKGQPHEFQDAFLDLSHISDSKPHINNSLNLVENIGSQTAEALLIKLGLLKQGEGLDDLKASDRWRSWRGARHAHNYLSGGTDYNAKVPGGTWGYPVDGNILGLSVGVTEHIDLNKTEGRYKVRLSFSNDRVKTILQNPQTPSAFTRIK